MRTRPLSSLLPLATVALAVAWAPACKTEETIPFSERPELREEAVLGCGGGGLRFLVPARAQEALRAAATEELADEAPHYLESVRVPCERCDERGGVCGFAVARFRSAPGSGEAPRRGVRLRFRSTVASSEQASSWRLLDSSRLVDDVRLIGVVDERDAARVIDWARAQRASGRPLQALAGRDVLTDVSVPDGAEFRLDELVRAGEGEVLYTRVYVRATDGGGYEVVGEAPHAEDATSSALP